MEQTKKSVKSSNRAKKSNAASRKTKDKKNKLGIVLGVLVAVGALAFGGIYFYAKSVVDKVPADTICNNVYVDEIDFSGMKEAEAKDAIASKLSEYQSLKVDLLAEEEKVQVTLADLGFGFDNAEEVLKDALAYGKEGSVWERYSQMKELEDNKKVFKLTFSVDEKAIQTVIEEKVPELENAAKDATITRKDGQFVLTDDEKGVAIDAVESTKVIETYFNETWNKKSAEIKLVTKIDEPKITRAALEEVKDLLGTFTTNCGVGGGRVQNIKTGAGHINGTLLMPGQEFSADEAMRPYTYENGYAEAGSYEKGKVVQSMGGGICQVSSTLYNAVILAELEIVERYAHSMIVGYVEPSMDAAIAGDVKDLKLKNNMETPVYIEGYVSGSYITFNVYGKETRPESRTIKYVSEVLSNTPAAKNFTASGDALGTIKKASSGYPKMKAQTWKVVYENGVEVSRDVYNKSNYITAPAEYTVGTATDNAEAKAIVTAAIATNDEAAINAAIAQAQAIIVAASQPPATPPAEGTGEPAPAQ